MRRIATFLCSVFTTLTVAAQGWPQNYDGVMLQGFYWDSYSDTRWTRLESQADELSQYFQLIWVPQSGYCNSTTMQMGYSDIWWLDHKSAFGTEAELRQMIKTFNRKGVGVIEDVVINHKNGNTSWCDFPNESKNGYTLTWDNTNFSAICSDDECNTSANLSKWSKNGQKTTGAKDTGDNFDGCRDLDHTNAQVQQNVNTYLDFLLNDLGYTGFRYDMVKGYSASFIGTYNTSAQPAFSVGEYWDGNTTLVKNWIDGTKANGAIQSAAFDFPLKYQINRAFQNGAWSALATTTLTTTVGYDRYSVTFVDNHDTGKNPANSSDGPLAKNVCAANAYILALPGTPCLWLKHWQNYKGTLKRLIAARHAAGVTNQSTIVQRQTVTGGFLLQVKGTKGSVMLALGSAEPATSGWQLAVEGANFKYYVSQGLDLAAVNAVTDQDGVTEVVEKVDIPDFCVIEPGEVCAFFEAPSTWGSVKCWAWTSGDNFTYANGGWPGVDCTLVGTAGNGNKVWKWTWDGTKQNNTSATQPAQIIFSYNGSANQTADLDFEQGGYYNRDGLLVNVATDVQTVRQSGQRAGRVYDLHGRQVRQPKRGVYVVNGKKYVRRSASRP